MRPLEQLEFQPVSQPDLQIAEVPFARQVEDCALPALQIPTEQRLATDTDGPIRLFIP
jgi:hypothetical protein